MKTKVFLIALGCTMGIFGASAQKGVDNGTQYGSGEDSARCVKNISLFVPFAKSGDFKSAYEPWKLVYDECPGSTKNIYLYGAKILAWQIQNEKDPAKKDALIAELMNLYDKRVQYFGDDKKYGKDYIVGNKAQDYYEFKKDKADSKEVYKWTKEVVDEFKQETDLIAMSMFMYSSLNILASDQTHKENYIKDYLTSTAYLDQQLAKMKAANIAKEVEKIEAVRAGIDQAFATSGAADCETLQSIYGPKIEENKTNIESLKESLALLRRMRCTESDAYLAAAKYAHQIQPTAESAMGMAKQALKNKDYSTAMKYYEESAQMETDNLQKAELYYSMAVMSYEQKNFAQARQYCNKAVEFNPNYAAPYMLVATMYATSAASLYPGDPVMQKVVYYLVIDKLEKARSVDPSCADQVNPMISRYRSSLPSKEDVFMHPDLENGKTVTIGGWIGERTTIR
ncbi:MAG: tetratricopeptide repeat protein [Tannerellaceae bacterium]